MYIVYTRSSPYRPTGTNNTYSVSYGPGIVDEKMLQVKFYGTFANPMTEIKEGPLNIVFSMFLEH